MEDLRRRLAPDRHHRAPHQRQRERATRLREPGAPGQPALEQRLGHGQVVVDLVDVDGRCEGIQQARYRHHHRDHQHRRRGTLLGRERTPRPADEAHQREHPAPAQEVQRSEGQQGEPQHGEAGREGRHEARAAQHEPADTHRGRRPREGGQPRQDRPHEGIAGHPGIREVDHHDQPEREGQQGEHQRSTVATKVRSDST